MLAPATIEYATPACGQPWDDALSKLGNAGRDRFLKRLNMMAVIKAHGGDRKTALQVAKAYGQKGNTVYQLFRKWTNANEDWRVLIDKRHSPELWDQGNGGLPDEFLVYFRSLCDKYQRKLKPAFRELQDQLRRWRSGSACPIPGYDAPPPNATGSNMPKGMSYENLLRHAPSATERAASIRGRFAASMTLPTVHRTRVGSYPLMEVQFDDMWHDFEVIRMGQRGSSRLVQFGAVDMFTTYMFNPGLKPRLKNLATDKTEYLNKRDFIFYLLWFLTDIGWHEDGTVLVLENGTAAVDRNFEERLHKVTNGLVTVRTGAMSGRSAISGGYGEKGKGNPRFKALKEGLGNLVHNELAALPGQVGMNRDHMPLENFGRNKASDELAIIVAAHPELADKLQYPFLTVEQARDVIMDTYRKINGRDGHNMEGWEAAGLMRQEFRVDTGSDVWMPLSKLETLPPERRAMMEMILAEDPECSRVHPLSPAEAMATVKGKTRRLSPAGLSVLLPRENFVNRKVRNRLFEFEDAELGEGKWRYLARVKDEAGIPVLLRSGDVFGTCVNPFNTDQMLVVDARGVFVGVCERWKSVYAHDVDAIHRMHGKKERIYRESIAELVSRSGGEASNLALRNGRVIQKHVKDLDSKAARGLDSDDLLGDQEPEDYRESGQVSGLDASDLLEVDDE